MVSRTPILQICNAVVVLKQRLASFQHLLHIFRCLELSGYWALRPVLVLLPINIVHQCVSFWVLLPTDPSKNSITFFTSKIHVYSDLKDSPT